MEMEERGRYAGKTKKGVPLRGYGQKREED